MKWGRNSGKGCERMESFPCEFTVLESFALAVFTYFTYVYRIIDPINQSSSRRFYGSRMGCLSRFHPLSILEGQMTWQRGGLHRLTQCRERSAWFYCDGIRLFGTCDSTFVSSSDMAWRRSHSCPRICPMWVICTSELQNGAIAASVSA